MKEIMIVKKRRAKSSQSNKGFTLVEVIIAIAILAVAFSPLLMNLVQSARINGKARKVMDATNMAQNIMEGLNAYTADEIIKSFDSYTAGGELSVLPTGMACTEYGEVSDGTTINYKNDMSTGPVSGTTPVYTKVVKNSDDLYVATEVKKNADQKYNLYIKDIDGATYTDYDVKLTMDTAPYHKANDTDPDEYNDMKTANIANINKVFDAVWQDKGSDFDAAAAEIKNSGVGSSWSSKEQIINNTKRKLEVEVVNAGTDADPRYLVNVNNTYLFRSDSTDLYSHEFSSGLQNIYDMAETGQSPRNVYIYYWPNYRDAVLLGKQHRDEIVISNNTELPIHFYLIRMKVDKTDLTKDTTSNLEDSFAINLSVSNYLGTVQNINGTDADTKEKLEEFCKTNTQIFTNMQENVYYTHKENMEEDPPGHLKYNYFKKDRIGVNYRCADPSTKVYGSFMEVTSQDNKDILINNLSDDREKDRIFKVKLEVYTKGAADAGFPEGKRVATFTGGALQ